MLTLLTDFGTQDAYVGVMKGVIAQINPQLTVVDLTHAVPPQDIASARFNLMNAFPYFPKETVHVVVVDPGVGSQRRAIAIRCGDATHADGYIVAPDNGVASGVLAQWDPTTLTIVDLTNTHYWRTPTPSATFHGRDIFAPVGAHLASGTPIEHLGSQVTVDSLVSFPIEPPQCHQQSITGSIQYIDHFGNLITNIPGDTVTKSAWSVRLGEVTMPAGATYSTSPPGHPLALVGSHGWVEIAVNRGNAAQSLQRSVSDPVKVLLH